MKSSETTLNKGRISHLVELDLSLVESTMGYHGTSIEAIKHLIEKGFIPGDREGDLYFYGRDVSAFTDETRKAWKRAVNWSDIDPIDDIAIYAAHIAQEHAFAIRVGFDLNAPTLKDRRGLFDEFYDKNWLNYEAANAMKNFGVDSDRFREIFEEVTRYSGVILGLSRELQESHSVLTGDPGDATDLKVCLGDSGLRIDDITGVRLLGEPEWSYFREHFPSSGK